MKIAFTSCMSAQMFNDQPVWDEIAKVEPDVLVLLGDSIYLDVGGPFGSVTLMKLAETELAQHAHTLYTLQIEQPQFKALVQQPNLTTYAIWDDHDFLWNNACGADVAASPLLRGLAYPSRAMFAAWRSALANRLSVGSFPDKLPFWSNDTPAPGYSCVQIGEGIYLHLTDGRSFKRRNGKALLGSAQIAQLETQLEALPAGAVHLICSGIVFEANSGECWLACQNEHQKLLAMAQRYNLFMLSGDIHDNNLAAYQIDQNANRYLYEATASGAALRIKVIFGSLQRNWGLIEINDTELNFALFKAGSRHLFGSLDRRSWLSRS
jgi:alkaline phosphatase D